MKKTLPLAILFALCITACSEQKNATPTTTTPGQTTTGITISDKTAPELALDEFITSTTTNPETQMVVDEIGSKLVDAWWHPTTATTYSQLADNLEAKGSITTELAEKWREQGSQAVIPAPETTEIIKMWTVRAADTNATFQISALAEGADEETLTFIEFVKENGAWKASEIA